PRTVSAKLAAVPASSPAGALEGTRNLVAFTTRRYRTEPLVISGPGAGAEVTAAGILNDIYSLSARCRDAEKRKRGGRNDDQCRHESREHAAADPEQPRVRRGAGNAARARRA